MRLITSAAALTIACSLAACATSPQNPIYQQTTKYKASSPYAQSAPVVQQASYQTQAPAPVTYVRETAPQTYAPQQATYTQVNAQCLNGASAATYDTAGNIINCAPVSVPASAAGQSAVITPAYQSTSQTAPVYTQAAVTTPHAPAQVQSIPPQPGIQETVEAFGDAGTPGYYAVNGITPPAPAPANIPEPAAKIVEVVTPSPETNTPPAYSVGTAQHTVIKGDTVYSLARTSCVSLSEFKQINNINDEFYIRVGQGITIPTGRCQIKSQSIK